jgi:hypothetical protein
VGLLIDGDRLQSTQRRSLPRSLGAQRSMLIRQSNRFVDAEEKFHLEISVLWCCWGEWNSRPRHYQCVSISVGPGLMRVDRAVAGSVTDCSFKAIFSVHFAWRRILLAAVVLRSPTNPLLVTPSHRRISSKGAMDAIPVHGSWRVSSRNLSCPKTSYSLRCNL